MGYDIAVYAPHEQIRKWIDQGERVYLGLSHLLDDKTYDEMDRLGIDYTYVDDKFKAASKKNRRIKLEEIKKKTLPAVEKFLADLEANKDKMDPEAYDDARSSLLTISDICKSDIKFKRDIIVTVF